MRFGCRRGLSYDMGIQILGYRVIPEEGEGVCLMFGALLQASWAIEPDFFVRPYALGCMARDPAEG